MILAPRVNNVPNIIKFHVKLQFGHQMKVNICKRLLIACPFVVQETSHDLVTSEVLDARKYF